MYHMFQRYHFLKVNVPSRGTITINQFRILSTIPIGPPLTVPPLLAPFPASTSLHRCTSLSISQKWNCTQSVHAAACRRSLYPSPSDTPSPGNATFHLSTRQPVDIYVASNFWLLRVMPLWIHTYNFFFGVGMRFHFSWTESSAWTAGSLGKFMFNFWKPDKLVFHNGCSISRSHQRRARRPFSPHPQHSLSSVFLITAIPWRVWNALSLWCGFSSPQWLRMWSVFSCVH